MSQSTIFAFKFKKDLWKPSAARAWLRKHGHRASELHEDDGTFSLVQRPRSHFGTSLTEKAHSPSHPGVVEVRGVLKADKGKKSASKAKSKGKGVRHDLGKAQLRWEPWEFHREGRTMIGGEQRVGTERGLRYGIGLNGENEGASVILLEVLKVGPKQWDWEIYPKNDYGNLLPEKYRFPIRGSATTKEAAKAAVEAAVGLKSSGKRKKKAAKKARKKVAKKRRKATTTGHKKVARKAAAKPKKVAKKRTATGHKKARKAAPKAKKAGKKRAAHPGKKKARKRAAHTTFKPGELVGVLDRRGGKVTHWAHVVSVAGRMVVIRSDGTQRAVKATHLLGVPKKTEVK